MAEINIRLGQLGLILAWLYAQMLGILREIWLRKVLCSVYRVTNARKRK